jgi:hypothetical protein
MHKVLGSTPSTPEKEKALGSLCSHHTPEFFLQYQWMMTLTLFVHGLCIL